MQYWLTPTISSSSPSAKSISVVEGAREIYLGAENAGPEIKSIKAKAKVEVEVEDSLFIYCVY